MDERHLSFPWYERSCLGLFQVPNVRSLTSALRRHVHSQRRWLHTIDQSETWRAVGVEEILAYRMEGKS